jgi:uncharacterized protein (TIGR00369 family)
MIRFRTVTWDDPTPTRIVGGARSGLAVLTAMAAGELPPPPVARLLGFELQSVEEGRVVFALEPAEEHLNPLGTIHGGVLSTVLDSAMGCAVHTTLPAGVLYTTIELKVNFVRAVLPTTGLVLTEGRVVHAGSTIALAEASMTAADSGQLLAHATSTCMIKPHVARAAA